MERFLLTMVAVFLKLSRWATTLSITLFAFSVGAYFCVNAGMPVMKLGDMPTMMPAVISLWIGVFLSLCAITDRRARKLFAVQIAILLVTSILFPVFDQPREKGIAARGAARLAV